METLALFAKALVTGLTQVGTALLEKDVSDPRLESATEQLEKWVQRPHRDPKKDEALQTALQAALQQAGAPVEDEARLAAWIMQVGLEQLMARTNDELHAEAARSILLHNDPTAAPPERLTRATGWPAGRQKELGTLLTALREQLAGLERYRAPIAYADRAAELGLLSAAFEPAESASEAPVTGVESSSAQDERAAAIWQSMVSASPGQQEVVQQFRSKASPEQAAAYLLSQQGAWGPLFVRAGPTLSTCYLGPVDAGLARETLGQAGLLALLETLRENVTLSGGETALQWIAAITPPTPDEQALLRLLDPAISTRFRRFAATRLLQSAHRAEAVATLADLVRSAAHEASAAAEALRQAGETPPLDLQLLQNTAWTHEDDKAPEAIATLLRQGGAAHALPAALYFIGAYRPPVFSRGPEPFWEVTQSLIASGQAQVGLAVARWLALRPGYSYRLEACEALLAAGQRQEATLLLHYLAYECRSKAGRDAENRLRAQGEPIPDPEQRAALRVEIQDERALAYRAALEQLREATQEALDALEPKTPRALADRSLARLAIEWLVEPGRFNDRAAGLEVLLRAPWPEVCLRAAILAVEAGQAKAATGGLVGLLVRTDIRPSTPVRERAAGLLARFGDQSARDALVAALSDESDGVRWRAAYALRDRGLPEAVPPLIAALSSEESRERAHAAGDLAKLVAPEAVPPLVAALSDESVDVRSSAARALGRQDAPETVPALMAALKDESARVRLAAAHALGRLDVPEVVPHLIDWLADEDWDQRRWVRETLTDMETANVVPALAAALSHENAYVRESAAQVLGNRGAPEAALPLIAALSDEDEDVYDAAAEALYRVHPPEAVPALVDALSSEKGHVRDTAAVVLGLTGAQEAVPPLIAALSDENVHARAAAMRALGRLGAPEAVPSLIAALSDEYGVIRQAAAQTLGELGAQDAVSPLRDARSDPDSGVQAAVTSALRRLDSQDDVTPPAGTRSDEVPGARAGGAEALAGLDKPEPVPRPDTLHDAMDDLSRTASRRGPSRRDTQKSMPTLIADLSSDNSSVRGNAARALGRLGAREAVPALFIALSDQEYRVRISAVEALGRMRARQESVLLRVGIPKAAHDEEAQSRVRALIHLDPGRALPALEWYARQITDKSWAPRMRGQALLQLGRTDAARVELERAALREKKRDDLLGLAHFYLESRDPTRAAPYIQRALERSGHDTISLLSQAVQLWQENRREDALKALARAQERARHVLYLDDLRYEHFWRTTALTVLQEMRDAQAAAERQTE